MCLFQRGTGVYFCEPGSHPGATFRDRIKLDVSMSIEEVYEEINSLRGEFPGSDYHLVYNNCNHFTVALGRKIASTRIPRRQLYFNRITALARCFYCCLPDEFQPRPGIDPDPRRCLERLIGLRPENEEDVEEEKGRWGQLRSQDIKMEVIGYKGDSKNLQASNSTDRLLILSGQSRRTGTDQDSKGNSLALENMSDIEGSRDSGSREISRKHSRELGTEEERRESRRSIGTRLVRHRKHESVSNSSSISSTPPVFDTDIPPDIVIEQPPARDLTPERKEGTSPVINL
jgi:hypothetical protein